MKNINLMKIDIVSEYTIKKERMQGRTDRMSQTTASKQQLFWLRPVTGGWVYLVWSTM